MPAWSVAATPPCALRREQHEHLPQCMRTYLGTSFAEERDGWIAPHGRPKRITIDADPSNADWPKSSWQVYTRDGQFVRTLAQLRAVVPGTHMLSSSSGNERASGVADSFSGARVPTYGSRAVRPTRRGWAVAESMSAGSGVTVSRRLP
jgi:hypothetical protein